MLKFQQSDYQYITNSICKLFIWYENFFQLTLHGIINEIQQQKSIKKIMKLKRFLALLMSAMIMMLCFTACDDKDEPEPEPKPEPDPNEVPAPEFGGIDKSKEEAVRNGTFLEVFEYTGLYKHRKKKYETERERWYFYPADEEEAHKMNGYAHNGCIYNEYWQWVDLNNEAYEYLHDGWERYCKKKYGATYPQYLYSGLDMHYTSGTYYLHGQYVRLKTFDDSQFVLESSNDDFYEYQVYSFTGKKYDETNF